MAVYSMNSLIIRDADVVGLDPDNGAELSVHLINHQVTLSASTREKQPEVRELRRKRHHDTPEMAMRNVVRVEVVAQETHRERQQKPSRKQSIDESHEQCLC